MEKVCLLVLADGFDSYTLMPPTGLVTEVDSSDLDRLAPIDKLDTFFVRVSKF